MEYQKVPLTFLSYSGYEIDTNGIVYSKQGLPLKPFTNHNGYQLVHLCENGKFKEYTIHRLVAMQFIPNMHHRPTVNHKDGNKLNNRVDNLEWATYREQSIHARDSLKARFGHNKIAIKGINLSTHKIFHFKSLADAADFVGGNSAFICQVVKGRKKKAYGFFWEKE